MTVVLTTGLTARLRATTAPLQAAIDAHPFVTGLGDGTLPADVFEHYLCQDVHYLGTYARALAACAAQADVPEDVVLWAEAAARTVAVERALHTERVGRVDLEPSPTCAGYAASLLALVADGCYPVLVAGVLPCYTVYADVGARLAAAVGARPGGVDAHPYGRWLATWGGPQFQEASAAACAAVDRAADSASPAVRERMARAYRASVRWEWMFWDAAWRRETWPV